MELNQYGMETLFKTSTKEDTKRVSSCICRAVEDIFQRTANCGAADRVSSGILNNLTGVRG